MEAVQNFEAGRAVIDALVKIGADDASSQLRKVLRSAPKPDASLWSKSDLLTVLEAGYSEDPNYPWLKTVLRRTPVRSLSGITSITVLTKPFPCPGKCVFCPVDVRMPKSYIATEPGAMRAGQLGFDPYQQVTARLRAYASMGHPLSKIELIVLGGTWSAYPREYQLWFVKRLFDALNDYGVRKDERSDAYVTDWDEHIKPGETYDAHINASRFVQEAYVESATQEELDEAHRRNEEAACRCVGMSLETRPDVLDLQECINLRSLGATKIQIGIQSLDDNVLRMNKRGHKVKQTRAAIRLLRQFGFKVHAHWMANLHGSSPEADKVDYLKLFTDPAICPDELKVYPTVLIEDTELEQIAKRGEWVPFAEEELNDVLTHVLTNTPEYCRLSRIIRDIPAGEILAGNKKGNLRQIVERTVADSDMHDIRAREIGAADIATDALVLDQLAYETEDSHEVFFQFIRPADRKLAAFLRLSLPKTDTHPFPELKGKAVIREVHVYGQSIDVGLAKDASQHRGFGKALVAAACESAATAGFSGIAVISSVGTRRYYEKLGFQGGGLYHHKTLDVVRP